MIRFFRYLAVASTLLAAACAPMAPPPTEMEPPPVAVVEDEPQWRGIAGDEDQQRIDDVAAAWQQAIDRIGPRRFRNLLLRDEGELVDPEAALPRPAPPPGPYWCRTIKLGLSGNRGFASFRPFFCFVEAEGELLTFVKQSGSERPAGRLYADPDERRLVFLGALALGREQAPPAYGDLAERNLAGIVERVAPFRYRMVLPFPPGNSLLDVIELVPFVERVPAPQ